MTDPTPKERARNWRIRCCGNGDFVAGKTPIPIPVESMEQEVAYEITAAVLSERELRKPFEAFIVKLFEISDWPEGDGIDGCDFQDAAVESGILTPETRTESCGESCFCAEFYDDMSNGLTCYRKPEWLSAAAIRAPAASDDKITEVA